MKSILNKFKILFFSLIIFKFYIGYFIFGSIDLTGLSEKYLITYNSFNYSKLGYTIIPYFPFVEIIYFYSGKIATFFKINYIFVLKYISIFFEIILAFLILKFFQNKKNKSTNFNLFFLLILINPLSLYVNSFLGFFETLWIFFLLLTVYIYEFEKDNNKFILIPFFLALSISIKPIALFFVFYFYYKCDFKKLFILIFILTFIFLHAPYIIANINNESILLFKIKAIIHNFLVGNQTGEFGISEIEKFISKISNINFYYVFKFIKLIEILFLIFIYYFCLISNKIKSYEFIYLIFLMVLLFNDNLHENYLYWILPFAILINLKRTFYFSLLIIFLIIELDTRGDGQFLLFNYPNYLNIFSEFKLENLRATDISLVQNLFNILIYYLALLIIFEKKIIKKINFHEISFEKIKLVILNSLRFNGKFSFNKKSKLMKLFIIPLFLILFYTIQGSFLINIFKSENTFLKENIKMPNIIEIFDTHGNNLNFSTNIKIQNKNKNYEIVYISGYYSSLEINNIKIHSDFNILHQIHDEFAWNRADRFLVRRININNYIYDGYNKINIKTNIPHSAESFGLMFFLFEDNKLINLTENLDWKVTFNGKVSDYYFENLLENGHIIKNKYLLAKLKDFSNYKILKFSFQKNILSIDSRMFLILIFILIAILYLILLSRLKRLNLRY